MVDSRAPFVLEAAMTAKALTVILTQAEAEPLPGVAEDVDDEERAGGVED